jgi:hypothetical protein
VLEHVVWYFSGEAQTFGLLPIFRAAAICTLLYQIDVVLVFARWLLTKLGSSPRDSILDPENRHPAVLVLPTLLRKDEELAGLIRAISSAATNGYPGPIAIVACIDESAKRPDLVAQLRDWIVHEPVPEGVSLHCVGSPERRGKAMVMDIGYLHAEQLHAEGKLDAAPRIFFNMDADSVLGPRALERMVYKLTRPRRIARTPHLMVTSNVLVDAEECFDGLPSLFRLDRWLASLVGREYLSSISFGRSNTKILPVNEASGALFCTWTEVYAAGPRFARFLQTLRFVDWLKWWVGFAPPRFSEFRGAPLVEAMTGPGDDTWTTWLANSGRWVDGHVSFDFPRTPLHALGRLLVDYVSRPLSYDPLAKVYTKTPTTVKALFNQRLRWNSSRVQDIVRWFPGLLYHWTVGLHVGVGSVIVAVYNMLFVVGLIGPLVAYQRSGQQSLSLSILAGTGYVLVRLVSSVVALLVSECPAADWLKLLSLPASTAYHIFFNTLPTVLGWVRDIFWFGERTTFSPEKTLRDSRLVRIALAYRVRRAFLLACRSIVFGDVPFGWFWFGWRETPYTPSGFDGWSSGRRPPPVFWPDAKRSSSVLGAPGPGE